LYKEAHDDLIGWLSRSREKVPSMKQRPLSDKLALEHAVAPLEALLNKQAQGELLVEHLHNTGQVLLASTSPQGQESIKNEMRALTESFQTLFKGEPKIILIILHSLCIKGCPGAYNAHTLWADHVKSICASIIFRNQKSKGAT